MTPRCNIKLSGKLQIVRPYNVNNQRKLTVGGKITVQLVSGLTRLDLTHELFHYIQITYFLFWSNPALLNWRPAVQ